jgi:hypothetical protein
MQEKVEVIIDDESNREIVIKEDDEDDQMDFSNIVIQQVREDNFKSGRIGIQGLEGALGSQRIIATGRDATAREVALNGNLSFDKI